MLLSKVELFSTLTMLGWGSVAATSTDRCLGQSQHRIATKDMSFALVPGCLIWYLLSDHSDAASPAFPESGC